MTNLPKSDGWENFDSGQSPSCHVHYLSQPLCPYALTETDGGTFVNTDMTQLVDEKSKPHTSAQSAVGSSRADCSETLPRTLSDANTESCTDT